MGCDGIVYFLTLSTITRNKISRFAVTPPLEIDLSLECEWSIERANHCQLGSRSGHWWFV
jgi:hypothetical protein